MKFKNPHSEYVETADSCWLYTLLFGSLYFLHRGVWKHVVFSALAGLCTYGIAYLIYPFFAKGIVRKAYLQKGWIELKED